MVHMATRILLLVSTALLYCCDINNYFSSMLPDGSFLYCAPDTGRHGMQGLEVALGRVGIVVVDKFAAPEE